MQVKGEVERLEGQKAELMRKMIDVKRRELEDICTESHMSVPPLPQCEAASNSQTAASAQVPDLAPTPCLEAKHLEGFKMTQTTGRSASLEAPVVGLAGGRGAGKGGEAGERYRG